MSRSRSNNPERCTLHCRNIQEWQDNPDGYTQTEGGLRQNKDVAADALRICPGVEVYLNRPVTAEELELHDDGTATFAAGAVAVACKYFEAAHGPDMGS